MLPSTVSSVVGRQHRLRRGVNCRTTALSPSWSLSPPLSTALAVDGLVDRRQLSSVSDDTFLVSETVGDTTPCLLVTCTLEACGDCRHGCRQLATVVSTVPFRLTSTS